MATERACLDALRRAAAEFGESPSKAQYEALGLTPASATIVRVCGGWNAAKERAGLETFEQSPGGGEVAPKPDRVDLPDDETWEELSAHQRWYRKNRERQAGKKRRRRGELGRWLYEYTGEECACARCDEADPVCLDFHHREDGEKVDDVSGLDGRGFARERIVAEIRKCEVLCANCHRREHHTPPDRT
jgi:hypothetical protein